MRYSFKSKKNNTWKAFRTTIKIIQMISKPTMIQ